MNLTDCFYLGYISRFWSNSNKVTVKLDTDHPESYRNLESVLVQLRKQDQTPVPFFIDKLYKLNGLELTIGLDLGNHFPDASFLKGKSVFLPLSMLPKLQGKKFYYHEVLGFEVIDYKKGKIGEIKEIIEHPTNPLISVSSGEHEVLLPLNDEVIDSLDREKKAMKIRAPEGLIDLYLGD